MASRFLRSNSSFWALSPSAYWASMPIPMTLPAPSSPSPVVLFKLANVSRSFSFISFCCWRCCMAKSKEDTTTPGVMLVPVPVLLLLFAAMEAAIAAADDEAGLFISSLAWRSFSLRSFPCWRCCILKSMWEMMVPGSCVIPVAAAVEEPALVVPQSMAGLFISSRVWRSFSLRCFSCWRCCIAKSMGDTIPAKGRACMKLLLPSPPPAAVGVNKTSAGDDRSIFAWRSFSLRSFSNCLCCIAKSNGETIPDWGGL